MLIYNNKLSIRTAVLLNAPPYISSLFSLHTPPIDEIVATI